MSLEQDHIFNHSSSAGLAVRGSPRPASSRRRRTKRGTQSLQLWDILDTGAGEGWRMKDGEFGGCGERSIYLSAKRWKW